MRSSVQIRPHMPALVRLAEGGCAWGRLVSFTQYGYIRG